MSKRLRIFFASVVVFFVLLAAAGALYAYRVTRAQGVVASVTPTPTPIPPKPFVEVFETPVFVLAAGASDQVEVLERMEVDPGTKIVTGKTGRAQVVYPNKTVTRIDFDTEIVIESFQASPQQVVVKLDKRRIWSRVSKLAGQESYQVKTSTIVATVRGTSFGVGILPDGRHKVTTVDGEVGTACGDAGGTDVPVTDSSKIFLRCDGNDSFKTESITASDQDEWFGFNKKEDQKLEELYPDVYGDGVLGAAASATPSPGGPTPYPIVDCVGADGKTSRVPQDVCDQVSKFWKSQITPTKKPQSSSYNPTSSPTPGPTATPTPTPTLTPTPTPGPSISIERVQVSEPTLLTLDLTITGSGFDQNDQVELWNGQQLVRKVQSRFVSSTELRASFPDVSCGVVYTVVVNSVNLGISIPWGVQITDSDRPFSCQAIP